MKVTEGETSNTDQNMNDETQAFCGMHRKRGPHQGHHEHHGYHGHHGHHGLHGHHGHHHGNCGHGMGYEGYPPWMGHNPYMTSYNPYMSNSYYKQWSDRIAPNVYRGPGKSGGPFHGRSLHGGPLQGPGGPSPPMGPFAGKQGPWGKCGNGGRKWCQFAKEAESDSSSSEDAEEVIVINEEEASHEKPETAAMETDKTKDADKVENRDNDKPARQENKEIVCEGRPGGPGGPGFRARVMAAYWAGCLGLPIPLGPRRHGQCGGKMKGHHGKCKKMFKMMSKEGDFKRPAGFPPNPGPHGMGHPICMPGGPGRFDGMGPWGNGGPGWEGKKWMRRQMIREACHQFEYEGMDRCQNNKQDRSNEGPREQGNENNVAASTCGSPDQETGNNKESLETGNRPWDRWPGWQHTLQQIYGEDDQADDGYKDNDVPHGPPPMWAYWGRGFGRGGRGRRGMGKTNRMNSEEVYTGFNEAEINQEAQSDLLASAATYGEPTQPAATETI